jgi:MYXO-CTERM domain-containing protein
VDSATALLDRTRTMLLSESATIEDTDLSTEASNVLALENNMQSGGNSYGTGGSYADNSAYSREPLACSFAAGAGVSGRRSAILGLLSLGALAFLRRRSRRD